MPRIDRRRAICEARRECVPLARLRGVNTQLKKPDRILLLSEAPADSANGKRESQDRQNLPLQHVQSPSGIGIPRSVINSLINATVSGRLTGASTVTATPFAKFRACMPGPVHALLASPQYVPLSRASSLAPCSTKTRISSLAPLCAAPIRGVIP